MYVPNKKQRAMIQRQFAADNLSVPATFRPPVALLIDSPNAFNTAKTLGEAVRPDYRAIRAIASSYGYLERAQIFVNPGFKNPGRWEPDFEVVRGTDRDCDHLVVSSAVAALASGTQILIVVSGDHRFLEIAEVCVRLGVRFIAIGVPGRTNRRLRTAFGFHPLPTFEIPTVAA
jgi:hypothetical protein